MSVRQNTRVSFSAAPLCFKKCSAESMVFLIPAAVKNFLRFQQITSHNIIGQFGDFCYIQKQPGESRISCVSPRFRGVSTHFVHKTVCQRIIFRQKTTSLPGNKEPPQTPVPKGKPASAGVPEKVGLSARKCYYLFI